MPFAVIEKTWVHEDQSIPEPMKKKISRQDGTVPTVHGMALSFLDGNIS
jgi:hypothetical protein